MAGKQNLKTSFAVDSKHEAFYTGGQVLFTGDGSHMLCRCTELVNVLDVQTGQVIHSFGEEEDGEVTSFTISPDDKLVVLALRNLQLKQFDFESKELTRSWKAIHVSPISSMTFDPTSTLLATGGSDSTIKVWDAIQQYCTHNLRGHRGVVSIVKFHPGEDKLQLLSGGEDYNIRVWNLTTSVCTAVLEGHYSVITGLHFSSNTHLLYSCGRDKVVNVWNMKELTKIRTIPVYETVEGMVLLGDDEDYSQLGVNDQTPHFITAGSKGILRVWNAETSTCIYTQTLPHHDDTVMSAADDSMQNLVNIIYCAGLEAVATVSFDHNITLYNRKDLTLKKQFAGYNDEILDVKYLGADESHIVVATNSRLIKVFELSTWAVQILRGHTDIVLALDVYHTMDMFASSSKDNTIRIWKTSSDVTNIQCIATAYGHTKEILSLAFSRLSDTFIASASEDLTIKVWNLPEVASDSVTTVSSMNARLTEKAHDKDINSIVVSPNDKLIATGSQDKTAKLWSVSGLKLLGVFRGHRRGIWCVQFSPVDQCLATSSSDGTVKLWALSDYTCVRSFEGHDALVLNVQFINKGMQLLTSGSDGLMKVWTVKTSECVKTLDDHEAKIWALIVNKDESRVITGGADSTIIVWKDVTETEVAEERAKQVDFILKEQKLLNFIQQKKYIKALALAINLEQPFRVLNIMKEIMAEPDEQNGLKATLSKLRTDQIDAILRFSVQWNTNSKHCHVAQHVLQIMLQSLAPEEILALPNAKSSLEGLLPYTQKHMERMNRLLQQSMFVGYTWNTMRLAADLPDDPSTATNISSDIVSPEDMDISQIQKISAHFGTDDQSASSDSDEEFIRKSRSRLRNISFSSQKSDTSEKSGSSDDSDDDIEGKASVCLRVKPRTSYLIMEQSGSDTSHQSSVDGDQTQPGEGESSSDSESENSEGIPSPTGISGRFVKHTFTAIKNDRKNVDEENNVVVTPGGLKTPKNSKKQLSTVMLTEPTKRRRPSDVNRTKKKQRKSIG